MGYDYGCIHIFAGTADPNTIRSRVVERIRAATPGRASTEVEANRSIVVGPPDRWIFVGDSASATEYDDPAAFDLLVSELSTVAPTLAVEMSDSACVQLYLYLNRKLLDKFATGKFPFLPFDSKEEAASFRGIEQRWKPFTLNAAGAGELRSAWDKPHDVNGIVTSTASALGIYPPLAGCGFTICDESDEIHYRDWLEDDPILLRRFDEFHFTVSERNG